MCSERERENTSIKRSLTGWWKQNHLAVAFKIQAMAVFPEKVIMPVRMRSPVNLKCHRFQSAIAAQNIHLEQFRETALTAKQICLQRYTGNTS